MLACFFEDGVKVSLRHIVLHAIVEENGKLLLEKRADHLIEGGKWSLPGGFLDRNETVKQGVLRELHEETGVQAEIVSLFRINSSPNRPGEDRQNVAFEFIVKTIKQDNHTDNESSKVEWIAIENLFPLDQFAFDHGETIKLYLEYRKNKFNLPIIE